MRGQKQGFFRTVRIQGDANNGRLLRGLAGAQNLFHDPCALPQEYRISVEVSG